MPKSGTTTIADLYKCGGYQHVSHQQCGKQTCARCIWTNLQRHRSPFHGCDSYSVYAQLDDDGKDGFCFFPQRNLSLLHASYPDSTFVLNTRNPIHWINSVNNWNDLRKRLARCNLGPYNFRSDAELIRFYEDHNEYVRRFSKMHNHSLIEVDIEGNMRALATWSGIKPSCIGHSNKNVHRLKADITMLAASK